MAQSGQFDRTRVCPHSDNSRQSRILALVASLARPGGNATGNSLMAPDLSAKRLDILHTLAARISRIAILWDSSNPGMAERVRETKIAADQSHVLLQTVGPRNLNELDTAFADLLNARPDALLVTAEAFTRQHLVRIFDFANNNKIPAMFEDSSYVVAGGLRLPRRLWESGDLCRQDIKRRQAGRFADRAAHEIRVRDQPQNRKNTWTRNSAKANCAGG